MKKIFFVLPILMILILVGCNKQGGGGDKQLTLDVYVMSQCPYGSQAEGLVYKVMDDFKDQVNFNVEYIASQNEDGSFKSLHGEPEVEGDIYQLCVKNYYPDKFWDYLQCQNKNYQDLQASFESCANEIGGDFTKIQMCATGDEGKNYLIASIKKSQDAGASASPTFDLGGERYNGPRTEMGLKRAMCEKLSDNKPEVCSDLPEDKEFTAYLLKDERCTKPECQTDELINNLEQIFPKMNVENLDYASDEGKGFYQKYKLTFLPALLMTREVEQAENYANIEGYVVPTEDLLNLRIGASFDPTKEICDNNKDDTGNGRVDCDDTDCNGFLGCRSEMANKLDLFVMSMCPYGTKALDAMREVLDNFKNKIDFNIYYIATQNPDGSFDALHGQPEVDENIRELCAIENYPNNYGYMDYIYCRNTDIQADWQECAGDFPKVKSCFEGDQGKALLAENIKLGKELGIGASPTWLVNNKNKFGGIDAETIRTNFCQYNQVDGCENTLSGQSDVPAGGSCN